MSLIIRSLRYYRRTNLGILLGAAIATAVLVGALVVGDSVRFTLRRIAEQRLGQVKLAMVSGERFFRDQLADDIGSELDVPSAPVIHLRGSAVNPDGTFPPKRVHVYGVDERFWSLGPGKVPSNPLSEGAAVNRALAKKLGLGEGDGPPDKAATLVIRAEKPGLIPRDSLAADSKDASTAIRLTVNAIVDTEDFGRFSLRAEQASPLNVFLPLKLLQNRVDLANRANLLLLGDNPETPLNAADADKAVRRNWRLADAAVQLRELPELDCVQLTSSRVFIGQAVADAALPASGKKHEALDDAAGILTYLVNAIRAGDKSTPYSFVTAAGPELGKTFIPTENAEDRADDGRDEIVINQWLADDLDVKTGGRVELEYYVLTDNHRLVERSRSFRVGKVVPTEAAGDAELMPALPGLAGVVDCRQWRPGMPIDTSRIHSEDQQYWDEYRGRPKAFVSAEAGRAMWANRFGRLTAVRYPLSSGKEAIAEAVRSRVDPASVGLFFRDVRSSALAASKQGTNFSGLFVGMSFFLIVSALLLTALLFVFGTEQRASEIGTLLTLGIPARRVKRWLLIESAVLAGAGGVVGSALGLLYTQAVLYGLSTIWSSAVANSAITFHADAKTVLAGAAVAFAASLLAMGQTLRSQIRRPARELLVSAPSEGRQKQRPSKPFLITAFAAIITATAMVATAGADTGAETATEFFIAGSLLLVGGIALSRALLPRFGGGAPTNMSLRGIGMRNSARRPGRSLAVVALLACGSFLVVSVGANRQNPLSNVDKRSSGTGGFALIGETAVPLTTDLKPPEGREKFAFAEGELNETSFVQIRAHEGDDASCLNLNRAQSPRLLGVRPEDLADRGAFSFASAPADSDGSPWLTLKRDTPDNVVPGIADYDTIKWALGKKVGDTLTYRDERGEPFKVRLVAALAGSILQGNILISEKKFLSRYPSEGGYRMLLIDAPPEATGDVSQELSRALADVGIELTPAADRLAAFYALRSSYLSVFQLLGGLGMILGSAGMGVVVMRNVLERRGEFALLRAVGFARSSIRRLVLFEHWTLLAMGLACGTCAATVAVIPAIRTPGAGIPFGSLSCLLLAVLAGGVSFTMLATLWALKGPLINALRNE